VTRALFVLLLCALAVPAAADPPRGQAKEQFERGIEAFENKDYAEAAKWLERAYLLQPEPEMLFAWAQATRLAGDCKKAVGLYKQFLEERPTGRQADAARQPLARCEEEIAETAPLPPPEAPPEPPPPPKPVEKGRPFYLDPLGDVLAVSGLVLVGVGIGLHVSGGSLASDADAAPTYDEALSLRDRAGTRRTWGTVSLVAGAGLVGVAVWRFVSVSKRGDTVAIVPAPGGVTAVWMGRF
jgi:tetratricopeptide (TPR) repeat protein